VPCLHLQRILNSYRRRRKVLFKNRARTTVQLDISAIISNKWTLSPCIMLGDWTSLTLAPCRVHRKCGIFRRLISVLHTKGEKIQIEFQYLGTEYPLRINSQQQNFLFPMYWSWNCRLLSLHQAQTTQYWTCDGPNRQLHVGRYAHQRRWQRTLDSGRMDP